MEYSDRDIEPPSEPKNSTIYAIDTNVLLNIFKFTPVTAKELIAALETMKDVLFVPHHVLQEFWPILEDVRRGSHHSEAKGKVESAFDTSWRTVNLWLKRSGLEPVDGEPEETDETSDSNDVERAISAGLWRMRRATEEIVEIIGTVASAAEDDEWILQALANILDGCVGAAPTEAEREELLKQFQLRLTANLPPGNRDAEQKGEGKGYGDYFVWQQCLNEGRRLRSSESKDFDLTLVTSDHKDDWARSGVPLLARRELVREYAREAGGVFRIASFKDLIETARVHFNAQLSEASLAQVAAIEREAKVRRDESGTWSPTVAKRYLEMLSDFYEDQLTVLLAVYVAESRAEDPISFTEAKALTNRSSLARFSTPYKTTFEALCGSDLDVGDLTMPMVWSRYPRGAEAYYAFDGHPMPALKEVIEDTSEFKILVEEISQQLAELRS